MIVIFGTNVVNRDPFNDDEGFEGWFFGCIIILMAFSFVMTFIFQIPHGFCDISTSLFEAIPIGMEFKVSILWLHTQNKVIH